MLLCLGAANIASRAAFREVEDGVLWASRAEGVVAADIADATPAAAVGIQRGDLLLAINDRPIAGSGRRRRASCTAPAAAKRCATPCCGSARATSSTCAWRPFPAARGILYFLLAGVGTFTLLVGGAVRLRRPRDPATLHFLWLSVAFFGVFTFSFSGRLDRLDWVFFWADEMSILALPPLFLHFTLVFPERPTRLNGTTPRTSARGRRTTRPRSCSGSPAWCRWPRASTDAARFVQRQLRARPDASSSTSPCASSAACSG